MFNRVGIPSEMLIEHERRITIEAMSEISRLLSLQLLTTTSCHPMCNDLVERFQETLKQILSRMCVRALMAILRKLWSDEVNDEHDIQLRERLEHVT